MDLNGVIIQGLFIGMIVTAGCRENLPVKEDISDQVTVYVRSQYETVSHSRFAGSVRLYVTVVNRTEETLDDIAPISGRFEVEWQVPKDNAPRFDITRTMLISPGNIFYAKQFNAQTKRLAIDPNDSVVLSVVWNLKTNDSTYLLPFFPWEEDRTECHVNIGSSTVLRRITTPQWFTLKANVKIFDRLSVLYAAPMSIRHCIMLPHNGEVQEPAPPYKKCTDLIQFDPCVVIGQ